MALNEELTDLDDAELFAKLETAGFAAALEADPKFKLIREACRRLAAKMYQKLKKVRPTDTATIAECQVAIQFYEDVIPSIIRIAKDEGEIAFDELKDRGTVPDSPPEEK